MDEDNKLRVGGIYDLEIKGRDFGKCLYIGKRVSKEIVYKHVLIRRGGEYIFSLVFGDYSLIDNKLVPGGKRNNPLSPSQREYLDKRLRRSGL